jgi:hypothetical protein
MNHHRRLYDRVGYRVRPRGVLYVGVVGERLPPANSTDLLLPAPYCIEHGFKWHANCSNFPDPASLFHPLNQSFCGGRPSGPSVPPRTVFGTP